MNSRSGTYAHAGSPHLEAPTTSEDMEDVRRARQPIYIREVRHGLNLSSTSQEEAGALAVGHGEENEDPDQRRTRIGHAPAAPGCLLCKPTSAYQARA